MTKKMLKVEEAADQLSVHWQTVLDLIKKGELGAIKLGKGYRIDVSALEKFIEDRRTSKGSLAAKKATVRLNDICTENEFREKKTLALSAMPLPETWIDELFTHTPGNEDVISLLESPPVFRNGGWSLETLERAKPVLGEFLEVRNGDRKAVRVYRDGQILAAGLADRSFLGWGMEDHDKEDDEQNSINGLAAAEFISNFSTFVSKMTKFWQPKVRSVLVQLKVWNPQNNKIVNRFIQLGDWPFPEISGSAIRVREKTLQAQVQLRDSSLDAGEVATRIWKEYGYLFGMREDEIPYLNRESHNLDFEVFKRQR